MPVKQPSWEDRAKRFLKAELKRADVSYKELAERLKKHGLEETEASVASKLSRGTFAATFFLATLTAIGCEAVNINEV
jgi:3-mercaptopyruvate sulfurtransferase SseA